MRIAVGGIEHESCTFTSHATSLEDFLGETRFYNSEALGRREGSANTIVDGFLSGLREAGAFIVPLIWSDPPSGGQASRQTFEAVKEMLLRPLRAAVPVDGVLLSLHGAFSAVGVDDADGELLQAVRAIVGPDCPVIAVHDLHSNISETMIRYCTAAIVEDTYPHIDMAERGREAVAMLLRTLRGEICPAIGWRSIPMFWAPTKMITADEPMASVMRRVWQVEAEAGVLSASISVGYQWADVPCAGASVVVVMNNDPVAAQLHADGLAQWVWQQRFELLQTPLAPEEALERGEILGRYPIVLADQSDNPGGGAPGDSTELLRLLIERRCQDALLLYMVDPEAALIAHKAGVGATVRLLVGGKAHPSSGLPVEMNATVTAVSDGRFVFEGPMRAGQEGYMGRSAVLKQEGVSVVVVSVPGQPLDTAFCRVLGLDCAASRYIVVKSTGHFRSGFASIAGSIFNVDARGMLPHDTTKLPFVRLGRKMFPNNPDTELVEWRRC